MDIITREITKENESALALKNDPFLNEGQVIPTFDGKSWSYRIDFFKKEDVTEDCFPDEHYVYENMGEGFHGIAAYEGQECVGFALLFEQWNKYLYLDNILVPAKYRKQGVGSVLLKACMEVAKDLAKQGIWLVCQDNNLQAFQFYQKNGYELGGMNQRVYDGTKQEGKSDLYLFKRVMD